MLGGPLKFWNGLYRPLKCLLELPRTTYEDKTSYSHIIFDHHGPPRLSPRTHQGTTDPRLRTYALYETLVNTFFLSSYQGGRCTQGFMFINDYTSCVGVTPGNMTTFSYVKLHIRKSDGQSIGLTQVSKHAPRKHLKNLQYYKLSLFSELFQSFATRVAFFGFKLWPAEHFFFGSWVWDPWSNTSNVFAFVVIFRGLHTWPDDTGMLRFLRLNSGN